MNDDTNRPKGIPSTPEPREKRESKQGADVPSGDSKTIGDGERGRDDGPLDSLGKAISAPVRGAAEADEKALGNKR